MNNENWLTDLHKNNIFLQVEAKFGNWRVKEVLDVMNKIHECANEEIARKKFAELTGK